MDTSTAYGGGGQGGGAGPALTHDPVRDILAGTPVEWEYGMRREMQEIIPGIFLGPFACAMKKRLQYLKDNGITHIVCVRQLEESNFVRANFPQEFTYLMVDLCDGNTENIIPHFPRVKAFLDQAQAAGGRVLMHGNAGISRSGALLVAYMMQKYQLPYPEALRLIQLRRFCVSPNEGFQAQLQEYEPIYRAMQQAQQAHTAGGGGFARPKRQLEEDDDEMDGEMGMGNRNPAQYPPAVEIEPLPGHSAYCGPRATHHNQGGGGGGAGGAGDGMMS